MTDQSRLDDGGLDILDFVEPVDSASAFASRFREIAAAVLVQIAMDETAPPYARIQAAKSILGYSDGTPERSRPLAVTDLRELSYNDRLRVLIELLNDRELRTSCRVRSRKPPPQHKPRHRRRSLHRRRWFDARGQHTRRQRPLISPARLRLLL